MPFLEFLFCSFRSGRAEKGPCQGAALGCHTWERRPEDLGAGEGGAHSSLPPPGARAGGGLRVARIASVFLFALFLFCNSGPFLSISNLLLALKLWRFHCDKAHKQHCLWVTGTTLLIILLHSVVVLWHSTHAFHATPTPSLACVSWHCASLYEACYSASGNNNIIMRKWTCPKWNQLTFYQCCTLNDEEFHCCYMS